MIRALIADDVAFMRNLIKTVFIRNGIEVVGYPDYMVEGKYWITIKVILSKKQYFCRNEGPMKNNKNFNNAPIVKQLGHEDLFDYAKRIVNELSEGKYGESVVMDCGEGIMINANKNSTVDTIIKDHDKEFEEGLEERYRLFEAEIRRKKGASNE